MWLEIAPNVDAKVVLKIKQTQQRNRRLRVKGVDFEHPGLHGVCRTGKRDIKATVDVCGMLTSTEVVMAMTEVTVVLSC